ncbi:MAG: hypothetical protein KC731_19575 [Myxococcales bacterium]|nr:hypothetical protein [Myxococcales bacterium]
MNGRRLQFAAGGLLAAGVLAAARDAEAVDIPDVGGETLTLDISNTSTFSYRFDNRNQTTEGTGTLIAEQNVDDNYGEWLNQLYLRAYYWKFSFGLRLDSAVWFNTLNREGIRELVTEELGAPNLDVENRLAREIHSRYNSFIYPAKLWLAFKHKRFEAQVGDYYAHLGRGLVFSVRKLDELGIDTTVRGVKVKYGHSIDDFNIDATAFAGQLNPIRLDFPTGRVMTGSGSWLFFGFPEAGDYQQYDRTGQAPPNEFELKTERAKPSYLEDTVVGGSLSFGPKWLQVELNNANLLRTDNSEAQARCIAPLLGEADNETEIDACRADFPAFSVPEPSRSRNRIHNFGGAATVPIVGDVFEAYVEGMGQLATDGRYTVANDGSLRQEADTWGYAIYANINLTMGPISATLEGKRFHNYLQLGSNVDNVDIAFGGREFNIVNYTRPPTAESIFTNFIGAPTVCTTGGRGRLDASLTDDFRVYGWLGRFVSFSEADVSLTNDDPNDPNSSQTCVPNGNNAAGINRAEARRTDTWDIASGGEVDAQQGKTHYKAFIGARVVDRAIPVENPALGDQTAVFYRENYIRYDFNQYIAGDFSLTAYGWHRRAFEPDQLPQPWNEGENLLSLNWSPHFAFIFGTEYQTRPGLPPIYFNGSIQYRSKDRSTWYGQLFDQATLFVGQRRAALRCVGGVCRVFPAFEGARLELISRF